MWGEEEEEEVVVEEEDQGVLKGEEEEKLMEEVGKVEEEGSWSMMTLWRPEHVGRSA